jgi:hypothetical protein
VGSQGTALIDLLVLDGPVDVRAPRHLPRRPCCSFPGSKECVGADRGEICTDTDRRRKTWEKAIYHLLVKYRNKHLENYNSSSDAPDQRVLRLPMISASISSGELTGLSTSSRDSPEEIDADIMGNLKTLWSGASDDEIVAALMSKECVGADHKLSPWDRPRWAGYEEGVLEDLGHLDVSGGGKQRSKGRNKTHGGESP